MYNAVASYHSICGRKLRYWINVTTRAFILFYFYWDLFFFVALVCLCFVYILNVWGYGKLTYHSISLFLHLPKSYTSFFIARYVFREITFSRAAYSWYLVTFSGHIFDLKGVPVSSDLGAVWSAAFIVHAGENSPIKGTFVYLSVPISMHKSDQARRFIALPNVVKRRDTHGEAGPFRS